MHFYPSRVLGRRMRFAHLEGKLGPTHLKAMRRAYETVCADLKIGPDDPFAASVAAKIISLSSQGESDTENLVRQCVESMKLPRREFRPRKGMRSRIAARQAFLRVNDSGTTTSGGWLIRWRIGRA